MKRILTACAILGTLTSLASAAEVSRFKANGESADLYLDQDGATTSVSVSRGEQNQTYVSYYASQCTYTEVSFTCSGKNLYGSIPSREFTVQGKWKATLNTSGSTLTGTVFTYTCAYEDWTCDFQETPVSGGSMLLTWTKSSEYSSQSSGTSKSEYFNYRYRSSGTYTSNSAKVNGTVLGLSVVNVQGNIGVSKSRSITIEKLN